MYMTKIISKIQLRPPYPSMLLLNIHCCSLTRAHAQLLYRVCLYSFCKQVWTTFCMFQAYTPGPSQLGTSSHIATLAYFYDQANSPGPSESGRSAALLRTKLWTKSSPKSLSFTSSISSRLVPMAADRLKLDKQINITLLKETYSTLFFDLCQSSVSPEVLKSTYCCQIFPGNILFYVVSSAGVKM